MEIATIASRIKYETSTIGLILMTFDARSLVFPSVINSSDPVISYINTTGHELFKGTVHNSTGDTTYLNSGLIWAGGVIPDGFPKVNSFIVTFMKPGTYHYQCLIYPEMRETIKVKPLT